MQSTGLLCFYFIVAFSLPRRGLHASGSEIQLCEYNPHAHECLETLSIYAVHRMAIASF